MAGKLGIDGGIPVRNKPFPPWPYFGKDEIKAVTSVLQSGKVNYWTGEEGRLFEKEYAASLGCSYGVAVVNGTAALELALLALGIGPGDEVIVTPRTFIASASCIAIRGAKPVFADVDIDSGNITPETIEKVLSPRTKAIICVHLAGWPCDMDPIMDIANEHGLWVVEDCAQAHGAGYKGKPAGSYGHVACFSFCQDKILTTGGEGGMLITNDREIWKRAWSYKDHGKSYDTVYNKRHPSGFRWLHESIGTNWRLTEMQSAIGRVILKKLPQWVELRRRNAKILEEGFKRHSALRVTIPPAGIYHSYYKYYVHVRPDELKPGWNRNRIMETIDAEGIPCGTGTCSEVYLEKVWDTMECARPKERLVIASELDRTSLMFMVHPTISEEDMYDVIKAVDKVMDAAVR